MSTDKEIITYKRRKVPSHACVEQADAHRDPPLDVHTGMQLTDPRESSEKDPMIFKGANHDAMGCSMDNKNCREPSNQHMKSNRQMLIKESGESSANIPALRKTVDKKCSHNDLVVDASSATKLSSSGDSQLTSSAWSHLKTLAELAAQQTASPASLDLSCPPSAAFAIGCNVIPKPDLQVIVPDSIQHSSAISENRGNVTQERQLKREELKLLGDIDMKDVDPPSFGVPRLRDDPHVSVTMNKKPETLQLFPENRQSSQLAPTNTIRQSDCVSQVEQTSKKAPATLGLSLPTKPIYEGQTSKLSSGMHLFQDYNVSCRGFFQNPAVQSFPRQSLLGTGSTSTTVPRENRINSWDRFQLGLTEWSETELDTLWLGVRQHGLGNWDAMLLDPKLRFAPGRLGRDLAAQWDQEMAKLFARHSEWRGPSLPRGQPSLFMRPTLADMYGQSERILSQSNVQNQPQVDATLANRLGTHNSTPFNSTHTGGVMIEGGGMRFGQNRHLNHLVREPTAGSPMLFELSSNTPGTSSGVRNLNYKFPGTMLREIQPQHGVAGPSMRNRSTPEDLIIIDSDDESSEETVSDKHINRK